MTALVSFAIVHIIIYIYTVGDNIVIAVTIEAIHECTFLTSGVNRRAPEHTVTFVMLCCVDELCWR